MNMQAILKQAQNMQKEITNAQKEINEMEFTGKNGLVTVIVKGTRNIKSIRIEEDEDIKLLILHEYINKKDGKKIKNKLTLGSVIVSPYANSLIKKQYTKLLNLIFEPNELNMRNNIAHINNENSDYLCLGDTAVLMQLLWDIITEDIFE